MASGGKLPTPHNREVTLHAWWCVEPVYELLRAGVIESVRIGASRRIPVAAIEEYVERLRREAAA